MDLVIRNASIAQREGVGDIGIQGGHIVEIGGHIDGDAQEEIDARGHLVSPGFMDVHMHLDKALTLDRYDWSKRELRSTPRLTSLAESNKMKRSFTVEDVRERAIRLAKMCATNGTTALRTHVDVDPVVGLVGMRGVVEAKEACRDLIDIQVSPYAIDGFHQGSESEVLLREALVMGADLVGGVPEADVDGPEHVDRVFALATEFGLDIDFHTDQVRGPEPFILPYIARKTIAEGMQGRVMASHCFALGHVTPEDRRNAIQLCGEAGISICATPYATIQERVVEPLSGGVNVTYMSDNVQDAWQPFGNGDMLLLALFVARLSPWRSNPELDRIIEMGTIGASQAMGLAHRHGIAVGKQADLVILEASSGHEALVHQARKLWVLKKGQVVAQDGRLAAPFA